MIRLFLLFALLVTIINGCQSKFVDQEALGEYVLDENNGLTKVKEINGFTSKLTYRPIDFFILQELNGEQASQEVIDKLLTKYNPYHYFVWEISYQGHEGLYAMGQERFSDNVQNLAFRMGQYASLTTSQQDTIPLADALFPRTYGMGSSTTVLLVFNGQAITDDEWVSVNIAELGFGFGDQLFRFKKQDIDNAPRLACLESCLNKN